MSYYHVLIGLDESSGRMRCVLLDLSEKDLRRRFVAPYRRAANLFCGDEIIDVSRIRKVAIIRTERTSEEERKPIQEKSRREVDEFNRTSDSILWLSLGHGYELEDIVEAGENVTSAFISGPPGDRSKLWFVGAFLNHPWISAIGTGIIVIALAYWLGFGA